jgi:hypothetical protein
MPLAIQHSPSRAVSIEQDQTLKIAVVFTTVKATLAALKEASTPALALGARITLFVPKVVPYPLPLATAPALDDFHQKRFRVIAGECPVETTVQVCLCRDPFEALSAALSPASLVFLSAPTRWWSSPEKTLAAKLRRAGHEVFFTVAS